MLTCRTCDTCHLG